MTQDTFELPAPEGKYIVGSLVDLGSDPLGFLTQCAREYGNIVPMRLGFTPACLSNQSRLYRTGVEKSETIHQKPRFSSLKNFDEGLLTAEGESWFWQRCLA
jgi:hypothetical protein